MIEVDGLRKEFVLRDGRFRRSRRTVEAVRDISFRVEPGELVGYLGPNGAGKSTTVKMLIGILVPTAGHVRVAGLEPSRQRIELARRLGAMFGQRIQLWWDLPLIESFELLRHIYASRPTGTARAWRASARCSTSTRSCARRCASCRSGSASAAS